MLKRLKTAIPLILFIILVFCLPGYAGRLLFSFFASIMLFCALGEILTLTEWTNRKAYILPVSGFAAVMLVLSSLNLSNMNGLLAQFAGEVLAGVAFLLAVFLTSFRFGTGRSHIRDVGNALFAGFYICWPLCFIPKIYFLTNGPLLLGYLILVTKMADVGAYFAGTATAKLPKGNHKLAKIVSPKKSWEGLAGGILFSILASLIFFHYAQEHLFFTSFGDPDNTPIFLSKFDALLLGIVAPIIGLLGDLAESAVKRAADAKDSGKVPGLGGILDMLDSLIPMAPLFFAWLILKNVFLPA